MNILNYIKPIFHGILKPDYRKIEEYYGDEENFQIPNPENCFDFYLNLSGGKRKPTIIFIHGGGWGAGDKSVYEDKAKKYMLAGFHVLSLNYTLATEDPTTQWPRQFADVRKAIQYFKINYVERYQDAFHPDNIVIAGDSAGAHLALFEYGNVAAIVNMFGPCDLTAGHMVKILADLWFLGKKPYVGNEDYYRSASPLHYLAKSATGSQPTICPIITVHGTQDNIVPYNQALMLRSRLDSLGVSNKLITHEGGHDMHNTVSGWDRWWIEMKVLWWTLGKLY